MRNFCGWLGTSMMLAAAAAGVGHAQERAIGTFRWQLQPHCNIVTLTIVQKAGVYTLDGSDDQCGAAQRASVMGTAFLNPDGSVGIGLTMVLAPGGTPVHVDARIDLASLGGPWRDSAGNSGTFVFTPGPGAGGPLRPVAANGLAPGSVTAAQLAPGAVSGLHLAVGAVGSTQLAPGAVGTAHLAPGVVGAAQIDPNQVQARVGGTCPVGQYWRGIHWNGAAICEPLFMPNVHTTVDGPASLVGAYTSMAIGADGLPIISYQDFTARALRVTHCGNAACTTGNVSTTVDDPANDVGAYTSLAIGADGLPIISHRDTTAGALRVTHCGNAACTAGNVSTTVDDPANFVGQYSSIAIGADSLPIVSHWDNSASALRVTHCGNAACTAGNVSTTVDGPPNSAGSYTSIAIGVDGLPVMSHRIVTGGGLRVTHCGNAACTMGNVSTTVDDPANVVGLYTSLAIGADGLPIISHWDETAFALRVTHCGNAACTAGNVSTTLDDPANIVGLYTSTAIGADGLPIISHWDTTAGALRVTHCGNAACTAGNVSISVDDPPTGAVGAHTSMAIGGDGLPIISHHDVVEGTLRVTKCTTKTCQ